MACGRASRASPSHRSVLAAFPANLLFPACGLGHRRVSARSNIWLSPLMILGTQWYICSTSWLAPRHPSELRDIGTNLGFGVALVAQDSLPAVFPLRHRRHHRLRGSWNASIVAEVANWGSSTWSTGIGAYIAAATQAGDYHRRRARHRCDERVRRHHQIVRFGVRSIDTPNASSGSVERRPAWR